MKVKLFRILLTFVLASAASPYAAVRTSSPVAVRAVGAQLRCGSVPTPGDGGMLFAGVAYGNEKMHIKPYKF